MSAVTFHAPSGHATLAGSERAWANHIVNSMTLGILDLKGPRRQETLTKLLPQDCYLREIQFRSPNDWAQAFSTWWATDFGDSPLAVDGEQWDTWTISLNTAVLAGSDPVEWLARLHATCEIHGYVEGEDREWLSEIIEHGLNSRILRRDQGWEWVRNLLDMTDDEPVVMSYSVTDSFPDPWILYDIDATADAEEYERQEAAMLAEWEALNDRQQFEKAMGWLRGQETEHGRVKLDPDMWGRRGFGHGYSVFDLLAKLT
ncbi:MAG TPA: hypothetical protein VIG24_07470 [Acidimicrobiia bacterium]